MLPAIRTALRARLAGLGLLAAVAACSHLSPIAAGGPAATAAPHPGVAAIAAHGPTDGEGRNPTGAQIAAMLRQSGLDFETLTPGRRWKVSFTGHQRPLLDVFVLYSDSFTVVLGHLCTLKADANGDIYKTIARRNFDLEQLKLSVNKDGEVFASFEVPTRILDKRELLENIASLAEALDSMSLDDETAAPPNASVPPDPPAPADPPAERGLDDSQSPVLPIRALPPPVSALERLL